MRPNAIIVAYASESGNSQRLAQRCYESLKALPNVVFNVLDDICLSDLRADDLLLIFTSSFGDGEPPSNAEAFYEQCLKSDTALTCQFAVFGLGDVSYPKFCGFSKDLDTQLATIGGQRITRRVDADTDFEAFFNTWSKALNEYLAGDSAAFDSLQLQVSAYSENQAFTARITRVSRLNSGEFPVFEIVIDIENSGMRYQAGDLLYILPPANTLALSQLQAFYGGLDTQSQHALSRKELRVLSKPILRSLAKLTNNAVLKNLTKVSQKQALADYCHGKDMSDLLQGFATPQAVPVRALLDILPEQSPRAYSIASCGVCEPNRVHLCVREVNYQHDNKHYVGTGSHFLATATPDTPVAVFVRANAHFHLPANTSKPIIMIGAGTGIAPYMGFLQAREQQNQRSVAYLFFGERHRQGDFLYESKLNNYLQKQYLSGLFAAFSRDGEAKIYVQKRLYEQSQLVWQLLSQGAVIYVCGSKDNLGKAIDTTLRTIAHEVGGLSDSDVDAFFYQLELDKRYRRDLY